VGGNSASPERRSPAICSVKSRSQQKSFLFLLEEKIGRAQIKKCEENFFAGWRASASGGGAERQFRSKKFRAKFRISHHSEIQQNPKKYENPLAIAGFFLASSCPRTDLI
jgi:hypothetical protein